jgi:hypothetical protein
MPRSLVADVDRFCRWILHSIDETCATLHKAVAPVAEVKLDFSIRLSKDCPALKLLSLSNSEFIDVPEYLTCTTPLSSADSCFTINV